MTANTNFATWNPLTKGSRSTLKDGNLTLESNTAADLAGCTATMGITTGKWYWEIYIHFNGTGYIYAGLSSGYEGGGFYSGYSTLNGMTPSAIRIRQNGTLHDSSAQDDPDRWGTITLTSTNVTSFTDGDIIGFALDYDNKKLWISKNGTFYNSGNPAGNSNQQASWDGDVPIIYPVLEPYYTGSPNNGGTANFGQDSSFAGNKTSGSAAATDGNGYGDFYYTPPTGFLALCSANLPTSSDIDPGGANGADENPTKQFGVYTYTGDSGSAVTVSTDFQPDLIWIKNRSATDNHYLQDSSRGFGNSKSISSNANGSEGYQGGAPSSSGAQSVGSSSFQAYGNDWSKSTNNFIAWCWKANGGTTASNSEGSITSTVQANPAAGFSIVQYTGTGSNLTMGHGLTKAPEFMAVKNRDANVDWNVYHVSVGYTKYAKFNSNEAFAENTSVWNAEPTTDVINIGNAGTSTNGSGADYVCYAWHGVDGYSRFSTYTGNGNADGPFIFTGFRPKLVYLKKSSGATAWNVFYSPPKTFNSSANAYLTWDTTDVEANGVPVDFLSNGFKIRSSGTGVNENGGDFVYGAWGDVPLKYNNTF